MSTLIVETPVSPMQTGRIWRAYYAEAKYEFLRMLRAPAFALPFLVMPPAIYLLFGVVMTQDAIVRDPAIANYLFSGFSVFAVIGPAIFGVGCPVAIERDAGLLRLKQALPLPPGSYLIAKMVMSMLFAALAMASIVVTALLAGKITLSGQQIAIMTLTMVIGVLPFCALGLLIGAYASGSASPAFANLAYLPMLWLSGLFMPLPKFLQSWALIWPAFHLNQVALGSAGVEQFSLIDPKLAAAVLVGVTVLFGGLALLRLARA